MDGTEERPGPAGVRKLSDLRLEELEALLHRNREIQQEVKSTVQMLIADLDECVVIRDTLEKELADSNASKAHSSSNTFYTDIIETTRWTVKSPYFADSNGYLPPINKDAKKMKKAGFLAITSLPRSARWTQNDMRDLDACVKKFSLLKLTQGLKEKRAHLMEILQDKRTYEKMLLEKDLLEDEAIEAIQSKLAEGRSIPELLKAIKEVETEIAAQSKEPLRNALRDKDFDVDWLKITSELFNATRNENEVKAMWKNCLCKCLARKPWSEEETQKLIQVAKENNYKNWFKIAEETGGKRSAYQIFLRYQAESNRLRNIWTPQEDKAVLAAVAKLRMGNYIPFSVVADMVPGRNQRQIAQRWRTILDPNNFKGSFTSEEDVLLLIGRYVKKLKYREIAERYIPRRGVDQLSKRFGLLKNTIALKRLKDGTSQMEIKLDMDMILDGEALAKVQKALEKKNREAVKRVKNLQEMIQAGMPAKVINMYMPRKRNPKFVIKEEVGEDGQKVIKMNKRLVGGRRMKAYDKDEENLSMFFFTTVLWRKGRPRKIRENSAAKFAEIVRDCCQALNANLNLTGVEVDPKDEEEQQHQLLLEQLQTLTIDDKPIARILPPQHATMVGYRSLFLYMQRLQYEQLDTEEKMSNFLRVCREASQIMNWGVSATKSSCSMDCINLHLVSADSVQPSLIVRLHKGFCDGELCEDPNQTLGSKNAKALTVCGNIQQFYFIGPSDQRPCFRLCIQQNGKPPEEEESIGLELDEEPPLVDLTDEEDVTTRAFRLWKERFVAIFSAPAMMENYKAPNLYNFMEPVESVDTPIIPPKQKRPRPKARPKGRTHWKRKIRPAQPEESEPREIKKRRTQKEMKELYKLQSEQQPRKSRRATANAP